MVDAVLQSFMDETSCFHFSGLVLQSAVAVSSVHLSHLIFYARDFVYLHSTRRMY